MEKTLEQDYVISGNTYLAYAITSNFPYFAGFADYESNSNFRYSLPIYLLVTIFLRSINKQQKRFSIRINKIAVVHMQLRDVAILRSSIIGDSYMDEYPITSLDFIMGLPATVDTAVSIYNSNPDRIHSFKDFYQQFFQFFSDDGRFEWDFTKGSYLPGYGTFIRYEYENFQIPGAIVPLGTYGATYNWLYRKMKILISITIRDDV